MRPVVGTQQRHPQILCHCDAGASMRRGGPAQPGGASSAGSLQTVESAGRERDGAAAAAAVQWMMETAGSTQHA